MTAAPESPESAGITHTRCAVCDGRLRHVGPSLLVEGTECWLHVVGPEPISHLATPAVRHG